MLEWLFNGFLGFLGIIVFILAWSELNERIPPKLKVTNPPFDAQRLGVWAEVETFHVEEVRVGHVGEWETGPEVRMRCKGNVEIDRESMGEELAINLTLAPTRDAYKRTNIIGWAKVNDNSVEIRLVVGADEVRDVLNELRLARRSDIDVHGWKKEKHFQIEYFSLSPKL